MSFPQENDEGGLCGHGVGGNGGDLSFAHLLRHLTGRGLAKRRISPPVFIALVRSRISD
jgi:hypothetical protein